MTMLPPDLSIIILNWNVVTLLKACLRSLPDALGSWADRTEVVVVDNASTDNSVEMVRREFPDVRLIQLERNLGFSAGNNVGIRASTGKYIFLLNPDTVARPGSIALLAEYMRAYTDVAITGPRLLNPDGTLQRSRRRFPILATALVESTPLQKWLSNTLLLRRFYMLDTLDDAVQDVNWMSGAALMCRRSALDQVGMLDPGYFMFSEELDLCRRVTNAGWRVVYVPDAEITHYGGQSTDQDVPARHIRFNTSKVRYFRIHSGRIAGEFLRLYLLFLYRLQLASEGLKWLFGHKRPLRKARIGIYRQVLASGLRNRSAHRSQAGRVLLITGEYPPAQGGVGDYTCKLNLALQRQGVAAKVLTRTVPAHYKSRDRKPETGKIIKVGSRTAPTLGIAYSVSRISLPAVIRAARGMKAGITHIQYQTGAYEMRPTINLLPLMLRRKRGGAIIVTFHDLLVPYLFPKAGPVREWANRLMATSADAVVATNTEDAARLQAWGVKHVKLIPIGSNIPNDPTSDYNRQEWRIRHSISDDTTLLTYFGFLNSSKGLSDLLIALSRLENMGDYRLLIVGGGLGSSDPTNHATAGALNRQAQELGIQDLIVWTGYLDSQGVSAALLSADIAVLPFADGASFRRGSLLAVLEHGLPVITTSPMPVQSPRSSVQQPDVPELVDGENALLVMHGDIGALVASVKVLSADPGLRARLASGARELALSFDWDHIARLHTALYAEIMDDREE